MDDTEVRRFTCVQCPLGCPLEVTVEGGCVTSVTGNTCPRGAAYGRQEATQPERVVCALVRSTDDFRPVSVKTARAVSKQAIPRVLSDIAATSVSGHVAIGDVILEDVAGTGVEVVATRPSDWA